MRNNFNIRLNNILRGKTTQELLEAAINPDGTPKQGIGQDPRNSDVKLKQQQQKMERKGSIDKTDDKPDQKMQAELQKKEEEKQQQQREGSQQNTQMIKLDKDIEQLQAKIQGGVGRPADINKLIQLLKAKESVQKNLQKTFGLPTA